jgi:hypothetical protein
MFPWYSGTSADLLKTLLDLLISVRLFLGRFDMRTLQVWCGVEEWWGSLREPRLAGGQAAELTHVEQRGWGGLRMHGPF